MDWLERQGTLESRRDGVVNYDGRLDERRSGKHLYVLRVLTAGTPRHRDEQDARICHVQVTIKTWIFGSRGCLLTMILHFWMASWVTDKFLRIGLFNDTNEAGKDFSFFWNVNDSFNKLASSTISDLEVKIRIRF